jgi:photosystem II stability/assembly factor-like uncharacterized protein
MDPPVRGTFSAGVYAISIDPGTPSTLYAGGPYGVFKSTDAGESWVFSRVGRSNDVHVIVIDPFQASTVYAGTMDGFFRSTDGARTWSAGGKGLKVPCVISAIAVDPTRRGVVYVGRPSAVFRSTDGGASFSNATGSALAPTEHNCFGVSASGVRTECPNHVDSLAIAPTDPPSLLVGVTAHGIYKFGTRERTRAAAAGRGLDEDFIDTIAVDPRDPMTVYAGTSSYGLYKSTDGGLSWESSRRGLPDPPDAR